MKDGVYWVLWGDEFVLMEHSGRFWTQLGSDGLLPDDAGEVQVVRGPLKPPLGARLRRWWRQPPAELRVLCTLRESGGELVVSEVVRRARVRAAKTVALLRRLEERGEVSGRVAYDAHWLYRLTSLGFQRVKYVRWPEREK